MHMDYCLNEKLLIKAHTNLWQRISTGTSTLDTRALAPGQTHVWDLTEHFMPEADLFTSPLQTDQMNLYAQVLVGPNQWAYSNTNTVRFSTQKSSDGILRFTGTFFWNNGTHPLVVHEVTTDGERFLFFDGDRICKVPGQAVPSFSVDPGTHILNVTFSDNSPPVRFDIHEGRVIP